MPDLTKEEIKKIIRDDPNHRYTGEPELRTVRKGEEEIDKFFALCTCHNEYIPFFNRCPDCETNLYHIKTQDNVDTKGLHFIYECRDEGCCPPAKRKTQYTCNLSEGKKREIKAFL